MKKTVAVVPGLALALAIACLAQWLESLLPIHLIGGSVIALFIGMILNSFWHPACLNTGLKFTSKKNSKIRHYIAGRIA